MFGNHSDDTALFSRRDALRAGLLVIALIAALVWAVVHFLKPAPPRHIVMASGPPSGIYHHFAERYKEILAETALPSRSARRTGRATICG